MTELDAIIPKSTLPECSHGDVVISRFTVDEHGARMHNMREHRRVRVGEYTKINVGRSLWMSDTDSERWDHYWITRDAHGHVLITGLGMGLVVGAMLCRESVQSITVIEQHPDVVTLVAPLMHALSVEIRGENIVTVHEADAYTWKPSEDDRKRGYDTIWHDIWIGICADNVPEMGKLHRRYARWLNKPNGIQNSWCRAECQALRRRDQREQWRWT